MLVRRKLFSTYIDEYGDERLYSTGELILDEEDYLNELMYSDLEEREFAKYGAETAKKFFKSTKDKSIRGKMNEKLLQYRGQAKSAGGPFNLEARIRGEYSDAAQQVARGRNEAAKRVPNWQLRNQTGELEDWIRNRRQYLNT